MFAGKTIENIYINILICEKKKKISNSSSREVDPFTSASLYSPFPHTVY